MGYYIYRYEMRGKSPDDLSLYQDTMQIDGQYKIANPIEAIVADIYEFLSTFIDESYRIADIRERFRHNGAVRFRVKESISSIKTVTLAVLSQMGVCSASVEGDEVIRRKEYTVVDIDDKNLVYIVPENIVHPIENTPRIWRLYHEMFTYLPDAMNYMHEMNDRYTLNQTFPGSGFFIQPVAFSYLGSSHVYKANLQAAKMLLDYNLDSNDFVDAVTPEDLMDAIKITIYDTLLPDEQEVINKDICKAIFPYLSDKLKAQMTQDLAVYDSNAALEELTNHYIYMGLITAPSEEVFNNIHKALGRNDSKRMEAMLAEDYIEHAGSGYFLIDKNGNHKWYSVESADALSDWAGANDDDNPYYQKFQRNSSDTLTCLESYHPELLVDSFPTEEFIADYKQRQIDYVIRKRERHDEIEFDTDDTGDEIVKGYFYTEGTKVDKYEVVTFRRWYNGYSLSVQQCRNLLSGKEITIHDYKSKCGTKVDIKGELMELGYDDMVSHEFTRTDLGSPFERNEF